MNFRLKDLELSIDDHFIEAAEQLISAGQLVGMSELERHLWVIRINETNQNFEVEIQISPSKVKAFSCDCKEFEIQQMCPHVAAGLLHLRKHLQEKQEQRDLKRQKVTGSPQKLTTNIILNNISHEALKEFVRQYAKSNRSFALALKARFAGVVPLPDSKNKYSQLLETIIKSVTRENRKISVKGSKQIASLLEQFLKHAEEAEVLGDYHEVSAVLQSIFNKIGPVLGMADKGDNSIVLLLKDAISLLRRVLKQTIAPDLKEQIWEFGLEKSTYGSFFSPGIALDFIRLLSPLAVGTEKVDQLLNAIEVGKNNQTLSDQQEIDYLLLEMNLLEQDGRKESSQQLIKDNLLRPEILLLSIDKALSVGELSQAVQLAKQGLASNSTIEIHNRLREHLLDIAIQRRERQRIKTLARSCLMHAHNLKFYELLKSHFPKGWPKLVKELLEELKNQPYSLQQRDVLAAMLSAEQQYDQLLAYIEQIESLDLLMAYDHILMDGHQSQIYQLYEKLLNNYLGNHLGRQSSQKVRQIIEHLHQIAAEDLAEKLVQRFRQEYAGRNSLMEELGSF